jgi:VanZ family protein
LIDKVLHLILYTGLGICLAFGLARLDRLSLGHKAWLMTGFGILLGGLDEIHQMFVPGRSADVLDAAVDVLGVIAGWLIVRMLARRTGRRFGAEGKTPQP